MKISEAQQTNSNFPTNIFAETKQYCIQNGFKVEKLQTSPDTASLNWVVFEPFNLVRHFPLKIMQDIQWDKIWILVELVWTFSFGLAPAINQLVSNGGLFPIGKIKYFEKLIQNCEFQKDVLFLLIYFLLTFSREEGRSGWTGWEEKRPPGQDCF